jgi:hypothetical protein
MSETTFVPSDGDRARLRLVVTDIERELACLSRESPAAEHRTAISALAAGWARLVDLLALGSPPQRRECPKCGQSGMRAATRCGNCWSVLSPLSDDGSVQ